MSERFVVSTTKLAARKPDDEDAFMSRDEVESGISALEEWVGRVSKPFDTKKLAVAKTGMLILDGDQ